MLNSLSIDNYRNLESLRIDSLGRVNLITGKNNTGKSTLLEAIAIYASKGDLTWIYELLGERGDYTRKGLDSRNSVDENVRTLSALITNRRVSFDEYNAISIGQARDKTVFELAPLDDLITMRFVKYLDDVHRDAQGVTIRRRTVLQDGAVDEIGGTKLGFEIAAGNNVRILPLDEDLNRIRYRGLGGGTGVQYIRTRNIDRDINGKLWDNIALTDKEQFVVDALKIIEPDTEGIAFVDEHRGERAAVIKLSSVPNVLPLRSMGDGINRILTIVLALINSENGFLLIDEFENGLHYTVQDQLWRVVFSLAEKLNVQVFVTTHSEDCIEGFENALNSPENLIDGKLIRLDNIKGVIRQVEYTAKELRIATDQNIETR